MKEANKNWKVPQRLVGNSGLRGGRIYTERRQLSERGKLKVSKSTLEHTSFIHLLVAEICSFPMRRSTLTKQGGLGDSTTTHIVAVQIASCSTHDTKQRRLPQPFNSSSKQCQRQRGGGYGDGRAKHPRKSSRRDFPNAGHFRWFRKK